MVDQRYSVFTDLKRKTWKKVIIYLNEYKNDAGVWKNEEKMTLYYDEIQEAQLWRSRPPFRSGRMADWRGRIFEQRCQTGKIVSMKNHYKKMFKEWKLTETESKEK